MRILFYFILLSSISFAQVGIGTTTPQSSSILDLTSTNKALLLPRVANTTSIATPTNGMMIYAENQKCFKAYSNGAWVDLTVCTPIVSAITVANPTYQGVSIINSTGIGYNGEQVPFASTITIQVMVTQPTSYNFTATHPATGLVYSASGNFPTSGLYSVILNNNGIVMPVTTYGVLTLPIIGASNALNITPRIDIKSIPASATTIVDVTSSTGKIWMDRNLGSRQAATNVNDPLAFGNLFQWGRGSDGHEIIVVNGSLATNAVALSGDTTTLSVTDTPGNSLFIRPVSNPYNWRASLNTALWQGVSGTNNPCPSGYRLPTNAEITNEVTAYGMTNSALAFSSPLKLTNAGYHNDLDNLITEIALAGSYWSSTMSGLNCNFRRFESSSTLTYPTVLAGGLSVRCIKN